jgi:hypothetical protein
MPAKRRGRRVRNEIAPSLLWSRFLPERSTKDRAAQIAFENNLISATVPAPYTFRELVEKLASCAQVSIPVESLAKELDVPGSSSRAITVFKKAGSVFDQIAANFPNMYWWISDKGLNMAIVQPGSVLSPFDALAGKLMSAHWKNGRLSFSSLLAIAQALDEQDFSLKTELQPAQWKPIAQFNQKLSKSPITSFEGAVRQPPLARGIRRRLYLARQEFEKSHPVR